MMSWLRKLFGLSRVDPPHPAMRYGSPNVLDEVGDATRNQQARHDASHFVPSAGSWSQDQSRPREVSQGGGPAFYGAPRPLAGSSVPTNIQAPPMPLPARDRHG
jgi:hypothetical protein